MVSTGTKTDIIRQSTNQGGHKMSEKEKEILKNVSSIIPTFTEGQKEYFAGFADGLALANTGKKSSNRKPKKEKKA
jgi:hypothetical protein